MGFGNTAPIAITEGSLADSTTPSVGLHRRRRNTRHRCHAGNLQTRRVQLFQRHLRFRCKQCQLLDINGAEISIARMTASQAEQAIDNNINIQA